MKRVFISPVREMFSLSCNNKLKLKAILKNTFLISHFSHSHFHRMHGRMANEFVCKQTDRVSWCEVNNFGVAVFHRWLPSPLAYFPQKGLIIIFLCEENKSHICLRCGLKLKLKGKVGRWRNGMCKEMYAFQPCVDLKRKLFSENSLSYISESEAREWCSTWERIKRRVNEWSCFIFLLKAKVVNWIYDSIEGDVMM